MANPQQKSRLVLRQYAKVIKKSDIRVWNLVLACQNCNRGTKGKWALVPKLKYLERLSTRNNFLIGSHHPLRETLISQTGATVKERHQFLQSQFNISKNTLIHEWEAEFENEPAF